jgi:alkylhydroperoxidase family enzyme
MSKRIPRLSLEQMPAPLIQTLEPRVKRLGYLGEFFQCTAHQPEALDAFMVFTEALRQGLTDNLTELVALTVTAWMDNAYEAHQHERLCEKLGFERAWIRAAENFAQPGAPLSNEEQAVQRLVVAMLERRGHSVEAELEAVLSLVDVRFTIGVMMLVGRYVTHTTIVNSLNLAPPVPSIFAK